MSSNGVKINIRKETDQRLLQIRKEMLDEHPEWITSPDRMQNLKNIPYNAVIAWLLDHQSY